MPFSKQLFKNFSGRSIQSNEISDLFSNYKPKYDDEVMECMQFGICSTRKSPTRDMSYFHFWQLLFRTLLTPFYTKFIWLESGNGELPTLKVLLLVEKRGNEF